MLRVLGNRADAAGLPVPSISIISPDHNYTVDFHELWEPEPTMAAPIAASDAMADLESAQRTPHKGFHIYGEQEFTDGYANFVIHVHNYNLGVGKLFR